MTVHTLGYAAHAPAAHLRPYEYDLRTPGELDVHFEVEFCGICHSDVHCVRGDWGDAKWPVVPGHEIVGLVKAVGSKVTKVAVGDRVGVGCLVDSCRDCGNCKNGEEQFCPKRVLTYNALNYDGTKTYGGYGREMVVSENFILRIPKNLDPAACSPLLCAGITTYSPMKHHHMDAPGKRIGVVGLGGLGHMAVQFGCAFGNEVVVISHSPNKREAALELGAKEFVVSSCCESMKKAAGTLDFIVDTVSAEKDMDAYLSLLKPRGVLVTVGAPPSNVKLVLSPFGVIIQSKVVAGSLIGGIPQTQEMLDFCGTHNIVSMIEKISMNQVNDAYSRILKCDVKYRFVIDVKNTMPTEIKSIPTIGLACLEAKGALQPHKYDMRGMIRNDDVHIKVKYCGICHSDLHQIANDWGTGLFPMVPGHEIVGVVDKVAPGVTKYKAGDLVGVGCMVDSCRDCEQCKLFDEQYCHKNAVFTYNSRDYTGVPTYGGYGKDIVVPERFVMRVPTNLDPAAAAPLLCAGITTFSPMKHFGMNAPGKTIGVIGLGGLGHMAVKFGCAWKNRVVVVSHSPSKKALALELGASEFVVSSCPNEMKMARGTFDFLLDTVCADKDMSQYISLLKPRGIIVTVGVPENSVMLRIEPMTIIPLGAQLAGSLIGGTAETQEMLDFCGTHNITPMIEKIQPGQINEAYKRLAAGDVKFRFVIDVDALEQK